jgi:uncharacterized membrane protein YdbT with pleckstrin-like domain
MTYDPDPERVLGTWRRSVSSPGFWLRSIFTLSLWYWLFWQRNQITVTTRRVTHYQANLVGGREVSVSINNITEVQLDTPVLGALLRFANVSIQSKGGDMTPEIVFAAVERPAELKQAIFAVQDRARQLADRA